MKLHTCVITYNRIDLSKRAIEGYLETVTVPHTIVIVDNGSTDGTREWLEEWVTQDSLRRVLLLPDNKYPGYACNRGWELAPSDADFLHRLDNDFKLLPGWCEEAQERFSAEPLLGQLGLRTDEEEHHAKWNVGGNFILRRELWDLGLRFDERPWPEYSQGVAECTPFSIGVKKSGYYWARVRKKVTSNMATGNMNDPYYQKAYQARGMKVRVPRH